MIFPVTVQYAVSQENNLHVIFSFFRVILGYRLLFTGVVRIRIWQPGRCLPLCVGQGFIRLTAVTLLLSCGYRRLCFHIRLAFQLIPFFLQFLHYLLVLLFQSQSLFLHPDLYLPVNDLDDSQNTETGHYH